MRTSVKIGIFAGLTLLPVSIVLVYGLLKSDPSSASKDQNGYEEVYWQALRNLDYETGHMTGDLSKLNGAKVAIPGFVVPLEDEDSGLAEFLLVPSPKACIHVPPPPPNQMVMVRMKSGNAPKREWGPVWVRGTLRIEESTSGFGKVSFLLLGDEAEKYSVKEAEKG
jgi:hypothetical protein